MRHRFLLLAVILVASVSARAETVELKDGTKVVGTVVDENDDTLTLKVKFGTISYPKSDIKSREAGEAPAPEPVKNPKGEVAKTAKPEKPASKTTPAADQPKPKPEADKTKTATAEPSKPDKPEKLAKPAPKITFVDENKPDAGGDAPAPEFKPAAPGTLGGSPSSKTGNAHDDNSARDLIKMKDGTEQRGFFVSETDTEIVFDIVMSGRKVAKTMLSRTNFNKAEVDTVTKLTEADRAAALKDLKNAEKEAKADANAEQGVAVGSTKWALKKDPKILVDVKMVELKHFKIESDCDDELVRKFAFRLDKVFNAYQQHFGCDRNEEVKVEVKIYNSMESYYGSVADLTGGAKNPAFYAPDLKLVCAGCDVAKYERLLVEIREHHKKLDARLREWKINLEQARTKLHEEERQALDSIHRAGGAGTAAGQAAREQINDQVVQIRMDMAQKEKICNEIQDEIFQLNRRNDTIFTEIMQQMLATMYHEGFHAFLDNFLFTSEQARDVPRWLNEGLAQYFEAARLENGRFVLGQDVREKMVLLKKFHAAGSLFTLEQLMNGGQNDYMVHEIANLERSTKNYLQAWLLTNTLGEKGRLKREILQAYMQELANKRPPLEALQTLSGMPNAELEKLMEQKLSVNGQAAPEK
jgi:hypothetical protein